MDRRALLSTIGGSVAVIPGCVEDDADADPPTNETDDATTGILDVDLRTVQYVVTTYEPSPSRGIDPDDVVPGPEIPTALREPLAAARDGGFETDDPSDALLAAVDEFRAFDRGDLKPYFEVDGTRYAFAPTLPTVVAELADEETEEYDEDRVLRDARGRDDLDSEAVASFVHALTASGTHVPRDEYRRCLLPEAVVAFLDEYDHLEDQRGVSRIHTALENENPPYAISARELTGEAMWDRPVVDESRLDDDLVAFFERALASSHRDPALTTPDRNQYFIDDVPDSYEDIAAEYGDPPYYRIDGTVYDVIVGESRYDRLPVSVSAVASDDVDRELSLTVAPSPESVDDDVTGPYTITSRGGLPSALWVFDGDERRSLDIVDTDGIEGSDPRRPSSEVLASLDADEWISATYAVPAGLSEGTYVSRGLFRVSWNVSNRTPGDQGTYPFELETTIGCVGSRCHRDE